MSNKLVTLLLCLTTASSLFAAAPSDVSLDEATLQLARSASRVLVREGSRFLSDRVHDLRSGDAETIDGADVYGILQTVIENVLKEMTGEKVTPIDRIEIDSDSWLDKITLKTNLREPVFHITDGSNWNIHNLSLPFNSIRLDGVYKLSDLTVPGLGLTVYGGGEFRVNLDELFATVSLSGKRVGGKFTVKTLKAHASITNATVEFENLMNGEPMGQFLNEMLSGIIPIGIDLLGDFVAEYNDLARDLVGQILNGITG